MVSQEDGIEAAKVMIKHHMEQIEYWQRQYRSACGEDYKPVFLTDPSNRATIEPAGGKTSTRRPAPGK